MRASDTDQVALRVEFSLRTNTGYSKDVPSKVGTIQVAGRGSTKKWRKDFFLNFFSVCLKAMR